MQLARFADLVELALQADHLIVDGAAVGLDLGFTRAADKAKAAALAFKVGPGADKAGALIAEGGEFDLQHPFAGAGAVGENFEDQAGAVKQFDAPFLFKIALLHRRDRAIHQHKADVLIGKARLQIGHLAGAEEHARMQARQADNLGPDHIEVGQGRRKADRFGQPMFGQAARAVIAQVRVQDIGPHRLGGGGAIAILAQDRQVVILGFGLVFGKVGNQSSPS